MPALRVEHLAKSYGGVLAVNDVSFEVHAGEIVALIGPNGAGKTTCFNMLMGQIQPDLGRVEISGVEVTGKPTRAVWRLGVGRTFQIAAVYGSMTVIDNVQMALLSLTRDHFALFAPSRVQHNAQALALLEQVGLAAAAHRPCASLAYGDIKRLELAMALANDPKLLFLDEPTAGMAPDEREAIMDLVEATVKARHMAALFTEHDMDAVFGHATRILVLDQGRLIAEGTPATIRAHPQVQAVYLGKGDTFEAALTSRHTT